MPKMNSLSSQVIYFVAFLALSSLVSADKPDESAADENYASDLYYQQNYPFGVQPYQHPEEHYGVPSFTGGFGSFLKRQDGFADDSSVFIGIAAVAVLGIGVIGAFAVANELDNLRDDIENNDSDISTLQTRTNGACNALNTIGGLATLSTTPGSQTDNAMRINQIIAAANSASCT